MRNGAAGWSTTIRCTWPNYAHARLMGRVCIEPGCPEIVDDGARCTQHRRASQRTKQRHRWRKRGNTQPQIHATWRAAGGFCQGCAAPTPLGSGVREHMVALGDGGEDTAANTLWLCTSCSAAKTRIARSQGLSG